MDIQRFHLFWIDSKEHKSYLIYLPKQISNEFNLFFFRHWRKISFPDKKKLILKTKYYLPNYLILESVTENEIKSIINSLKRKNLPRVDNVTSEAIKTIWRNSVTSLKLNKIYTFGKYLKPFKTSIIVPIHKKWFKISYY